MLAARFAFQSPQAAGGGSNARRNGSASTNASLTYTAEYSATTSTTQYKFGTASQRLVNTQSDIISGSTSVLAVGSSDFTVEFWVWIDSLSNHSASCDAWSHDVGFGLGCRLAQRYDTNGLSGGSPQYINIFARGQADLDYWTLPSNWPTGQWNFVAIQRKGSDVSCWVEGTLLSRADGPNGTASGYTFSSTAGQNRIGTADGGNGLGPSSGSNYVYIDEFCVSNTYRYTDTSAAIPVPTAAFTVDSYTTQLLHMDGSNGGTTFTNATS